MYVFYALLKTLTITVILHLKKLKILQQHSGVAVEVNQTNKAKCLSI